MNYFCATLYTDLEIVCYRNTVISRKLWNTGQLRSISSNSMDCTTYPTPNKGYTMETVVKLLAI